MKGPSNFVLETKNTPNALVCRNMHRASSGSSRSPWLNLSREHHHKWASRSVAIFTIIRQKAALGTVNMVKNINLCIL